jgi:hypothetical protein
MAARFILAVAAKGEISRVGQRREEVKGMPWGRLVHLFPEGAGESAPVFVGSGRLGVSHEFPAWGQNWIPDVEPIFYGVTALRNSTRGEAHRAQT